MADQNTWQWNEMQQVGTDYTDMAEVERYEQRMGQFRDIVAEDAAILAQLALPEGARILEIGTGTGHFARAAAKAGYRVTAVDVSPVMLQYAQSRAKADGLADLQRFHHAGFLTLSFEPATFDAAASVAALHHLPDTWKAVALANIHRVLRPGGRFILRDVVFSWEGSNAAACFDAFVDSCPDNMRKQAARHIAREYSTLDWIMRGLLERSGFAILRVDAPSPGMFQYLSEKQ